MESTQGQWELRVKNTFVDLPLEPDFFDEIPALRCISQPALKCAAYFQDPRGRPVAAPSPEHVRQDDTREMQIRLDTIESMPTTTLDSLPSMTMGTVESLPIVEEELADNTKYLQRGCSERCSHSPLFAPHHGKVLAEIDSSATGHQPIPQCSRESSTAPNEAQPSSSDPLGLVTTLMLCNLPCKLSQEGLATAVNQLGFAGTYDLIYIPRGSNNLVGYGFINFCSPEMASSFSSVITSFAFQTARTNKPVRVMPAKSQGLMNTLASIQKGDNFRRRSHAPLIFGQAP